MADIGKMLNIGADNRSTLSYGIRSCSHAARIASYETTSALATLPGPEVGMALRPIGPPGPGFPNLFPSRQHLPGTFL